MMELNEANVKQVLGEILYMTPGTSEEDLDAMQAHLNETGEIPDDAVAVKLLTSQALFHKGRLAEQRQNLLDLLSQIPDQFRVSGSGGASILFLNENEEGEEWMPIQDAEMLIAVVLATGRARWLVPRDIWHVLPQGVPYIVITDEDGDPTDEPLLDGMDALMEWATKYAEKESANKE